MNLFQPDFGWFRDSIGIACGVRYIERAWGLLPDRLVSPHVLLHGGCRGADHLIANVFQIQGCQTRAIDADWTLGKKAGPTRNRRMVAEAKVMAGTRASVRALALWDGVRVKPDGSGSGTFDCITACWERDIEVAVLWQLPNDVSDWPQLAQDRLEERVAVQMEYSKQETTWASSKRLETIVRNDWAWNLGWLQEPMWI